MARTAVAYSNLVPNSSLADPTGTSVSSGAGNGAQIPAIPTGTPPVKVHAVPELTVLRVVNGATAGNVTVKAGDYPPALASGQGDKTVPIGASAVLWLGPFESGRFLQDDGSLIVETDQTMTVTAFRVPRNT